MAPPARPVATALPADFGGSDVSEPRIVEIPLSHPDYSSATTTGAGTDPARPKTLLEIAEERQRQLRAAHPDSKPPGETFREKFNRNDALFGFTRASHPSGDGSGDADADADDGGPILNGVLYTLSLSILYMMLDVLVWAQYGRPDITASRPGQNQGPSQSRLSIDGPTKWAIFAEFVRRTGRIVPPLFIATATMHTRFFTSYPLSLARQALFFATAVGTGTALVWAGNNGDYYAVMKDAAPLATLWIWSVAEMFAVPAFVSVVVVAGWALYHGLGLF